MIDRVVPNLNNPLEIKQVAAFSFPQFVQGALLKYQGSVLLTCGFLLTANHIGAGPLHREVTVFVRGYNVLKIETARV